MKKFTLIVVAGLLGGSAHAQKLKDSEVPTVVKQAFAKNFPTVKEVKWSKESTTEFEAEFKSGATEKSANFDEKGNWVVTETEMKKSDLPRAVQASVTKEFPGFKMKEIEKVERPDNVVLYEIELKKNKIAYEVQFSADGKVIKKEEKKNNKKEKD